MLIHKVAPLAAVALALIQGVGGRTSGPAAPSKLAPAEQSAVAQMIPSQMASVAVDDALRQVVPYLNGPGAESLAAGLRRLAIGIRSADSASVMSAIAFTRAALSNYEVASGLQEAAELDVIRLALAFESYCGAFEAAAASPPCGLVKGSARNFSMMGPSSGAVKKL